MKTVFKEGQKVFDFAYGKGEVINVQNSRYLNNIILVKFDNRGVPVRYSLDGRQINFNAYGGELDPENVANKPTLSTKEYTLHGFEQKAPAPTFEEVIKEAHKKGDYYYLPDCLEAPSERLVDATMALLKLLFLRDYYNEGWKPDWNKSGFKQCIELEGKVVCGRDHAYSSRVLAFKSGEIRDKFLEEQRELLEIAKPLL